MIDKSKSLAGSYSGALDDFLSERKRDQLNRLSTEMRLIRKGFDVTDYLNEVNTTYKHARISPSNEIFVERRR